MKKKTKLFSGVATAFATPFLKGEPDLRALRRLISYGIQGGIHAAVILGTTGEAVTVSDKERERIVATAAEEIDGRIPMIVGTGHNDTRHAVDYCRRAAALGADGLLTVAPYYNKGTSEGVVRHFEALAEASDKPIILYNVPTRTGADIGMDGYRALASHENIVGIKEAKGDIGRIGDLIAEIGENVAVYTGNDYEYLPTLALGGDGVISVVSNLYPGEYSRVYSLYTEGNLPEAARLFLTLQRMTRLLFAETNPAPLKTALSIVGLSGDECRLPMTPASPTLRAKLEAEIARLKEI